MLGAVVDGPIAHGDVPGLLWFALALLGLGIADAGLSLIRRWIMSRATSHIEANIRLDLFDQLQRLPMGFHKAWESGSCCRG
nr:ABC transporter transmembrane domain-containing protein [Tessaracoccus coleopterorum]